MSKVYGLCFALLSLFVCTSAFADAECLNYNGKTACGYDCVGYNGDVQCAQTPNGACLGYNGDIECWDPPFWANQKAECLGYNGDIACGYGCVGYNGEVRCSQIPGGVCSGYNGRITCMGD